MVSTFNDFDAEVNFSLNDINISVGQDISAFSGTGLNSNIGKDDVKFKIFTTSDFGLTVAGFTMCYDNETGYWLGFRSYNPEMYGNINNRYFGFKNGSIYIMDATNVNNNFFGVQYKSALWVVMNVSPSDMKFFTNWSVESNDKWSNPFVEVANSRAFRAIESRTPDSMINKQDGAFYAPFMFDTNTPNVANPLLNGNSLAGETLLIKLENESAEDVVLFAVNIYGGYSGRTGF